MSRTVKDVPADLREKAAVSTLRPIELMAHLSDRGFKAAYVDGGKVIQSFLAADLIDSLTIGKVPVLIGSGLPLFGSLDTDLNFEHVRTTSYSNGLVRSYYKRSRND
jgi:dihydrofolate reductase